ncbi:MAG TPA: hypothetical protein VJM33_10830 [Microthrixaceae bacterium]|nr:hypothetical protein [Microthrixaceae bacterium]
MAVVLAGLMGLTACMTELSAGGRPPSYARTGLEPGPAAKTYVAGCDSNTTGSFNRIDNWLTPQFDPVVPYSYVDELTLRGAASVVKAAVNGSGIHSYGVPLVNAMAQTEIDEGVPASDIYAIVNCAFNTLLATYTPQDTAEMNLTAAEQLESLGVEVFFFETPQMQYGTPIYWQNEVMNSKVDEFNQIIRDNAGSVGAEYIAVDGVYGYTADGLHVETGDHVQIAEAITRYMNNR